ncbi:MAG: nucleotide-binding protein [Dehalococcoidia bacterium]|nr:nucleotide-binding protein [Dehalococcoidia bacterium]
MEQAQISKIKKTLESFLKVFDEYKDEIISERPQRNRLDKLRKELQIREPQITSHILNILGNGSVVIRSYESQATLSHASLLATALMGGNNELKHNFRDFYGPVTSLLNRSIGTIEEVQLQGKAAEISNGMTVKNKKAVFVVHGRNKRLTDSMFNFLDAIGLEPIEWNKAIAMTGKSMPSIQDIVSTALREAQAIIVLLSGDDLAILRKEFIDMHDEAYEKEPTPQARPNVLFEAGMAVAGNQERTILVQIGKIRKFSDIQGLHITHLDNTPQKKQELINKLKSAGCDIRDLSAENRWMGVGNFEDRLDQSTTDKAFQNDKLASGAHESSAKIKHVKIVREKQSISSNLSRLKNGRDIIDLLERCDVCSFDNDDLSTESEVSLILGFLDWIEFIARQLPYMEPTMRIN